MNYQLKKEALEKTGRARRYFDLSKRARELLKQTAKEQHIPQVSLIEMMIRRYCEPDRDRKPREF
jgi:hypothetical protein